MQLHTIGVRAAHLGDALTFGHLLVFFDQQGLVVRVGREEGVVVLDDASPTIPNLTQLQFSLIP